MSVAEVRTTCEDIIGSPKGRQETHPGVGKRTQQLLSRNRY